MWHGHFILFIMSFTLKNDGTKRVIFEIQHNLFCMAKIAFENSDAIENSSPHSLCQFAMNGHFFFYYHYYIRQEMQVLCNQNKNKTKNKCMNIEHWTFKCIYIRSIDGMWCAVSYKPTKFCQIASHNGNGNKVAKISVSTTNEHTEWSKPKNQKTICAKELGSQPSSCICVQKSKMATLRVSLCVCVPGSGSGCVAVCECFCAWICVKRH